MVKSQPLVVCARYALRMDIRGTLIGVGVTLTAVVGAVVAGTLASADDEPVRPASLVEVIETVEPEPTPEPTVDPEPVVAPEPPVEVVVPEPEPVVVPEPEPAPVVEPEPAPVDPAPAPEPVDVVPVPANPGGGHNLPVPGGGAADTSGPLGG